MQDHVDVVVIGAGQCGLAVGRQLSLRERDFVVIDRCSRVGDSWRRFMESLRLVTPAGVSGLTGLPFPAPARAYPAKRVMADYLEDFAETFALPCRLNTRVRRLERHDGKFILWVDDTVKGTQMLTANTVIVAVGFLHTLQVPGFAEQIDPTITQLRMAEYDKPDRVVGPVLVVGAGNSGVQVAYDLAGTHEVWLAGPNPGHFLFDLSAPEVWQLAHRWLTPRNPLGHRFISTMLRREPPVIKISERRLRRMNVVRLPKIADVAQGRPRLADGRVLEPATIIWTTGFRSDFDWIDLPILDPATRLPRHDRGVTEIEGLYFVGLPFQYGFTSHFIRGVDRDALHVVEHLDRHRAPTTIATS